MYLHTVGTIMLRTFNFDCTNTRVGQYGLKRTWMQACIILYHARVIIWITVAESFLLANHNKQFKTRDVPCQQHSNWVCLKVKQCERGGRAQVVGVFLVQGKSIQYQTCLYVSLVAHLTENSSGFKLLGAETYLCFCYRSWAVNWFLHLNQEQ